MGATTSYLYAFNATLKRWPDVMILITLVSGLLFDNSTQHRVSFTASSGVVNGKRGERYVETYREIDMSATSNSGTIRFAYIGVGDKQGSPGSPSHQGVWETAI